MEAGGYTFRWLTEADLPQLMMLQERATADLNNKGLYVPLSESEFLAMLQGEGWVAGYEKEGRLAAFHTVWIPGIHAEHLGRDLGFTNSDLLHSVHLEAACVAPEHRGQALQMKLAYSLISKVREDGRFRYLLQTVAPDNHASVRSSFHTNLELVGYKLKYGGKKRFIFQMDLNRPKQMTENEPFGSESRDHAEDDAPVLFWNDPIEAFEDVFARGYTGVEWLPEQPEQQLTGAIRFLKSKSIHSR